VVDDHEVVSRFVREAQAAVRVQHPNVVDVHDVAVHGSTPYLVMEFLDGEDLGAVLAREHVLGVERAVGWMLPVISALSAAHAEGIVHRDLKPQNVFLVRTRDGEIVPKVLDFGISKVREGAYGDSELTQGSMDVFDPTVPISTVADSLTRTGLVLGTPYYMPPEQIRSAKTVDDKADQWALAVMLFECVTGEMPMDGETPQVVLQEILAGHLRTPRDVRPDLPVEFERVILRALRSDPRERYPSIRALGAALLPFASAVDRTRWRAFADDEFGTAPTVVAAANGAAPARMVAPGTNDGHAQSLSAVITHVMPRTRSGRRATGLAGAGFLVVAIGVSAFVWRAHSPAASPPHTATVPSPSVPIVATPTPPPTTSSPSSTPPPRAEEQPVVSPRPASALSTAVTRTAPHVRTSHATSTPSMHPTSNAPSSPTAGPPAPAHSANGSGWVPE
jgi:serine/threonine-protein kinase